MDESEYYSRLLSQKEHHENMEHDNRVRASQAALDFSIVAALRPEIHQDGDQFCVLYGSNLQDGVAGFGDTIYDAVIDFNNAFNRRAK